MIGDMTSQSTVKLNLLLKSPKNLMITMTRKRKRHQSHFLKNLLGRKERKSFWESKAFVIKMANTLGTWLTFGENHNRRYSANREGNKVLLSFNKNLRHKFLKLSLLSRRRQRGNIFKSQEQIRIEINLSITWKTNRESHPRIDQIAPLRLFLSTQTTNRQLLSYSLRPKLSLLKILSGTSLKINKTNKTNNKTTKTKAISPSKNLNS